MEVLLLCPTGQDAILIAKALEKESISSVIVKSVNELCSKHIDETGAILIAEEALGPEGLDLLNMSLQAQEAWSDIPVILLTSGGARVKQFKVKRLEEFITSGNVTLLERPLQPLTLLSATQVALRTRRRQYQVRDLMASQIEATNIRDEFISIAGHELKTPLTSLKLQSQMAKKHAQKKGEFSEEKMVRQWDYTISQIDRLNKLVDDMLDISRISTGKLRLLKVDFNFSALLEDLVERFMPQFEAAGCEVKTSISPGVVGHWDAYKLEQVINNLFSNAIRYAPHAEVSVELKTNDTEAELHVRDKGEGIKKENLVKIFERFERASSTLAGLGLGLYITRHIIELHGGSIQVESEEGKGSDFMIKLPLNHSN